MRPNARRVSVGFADNNAASLYSLALTQERTHAAVLSGLCLCPSPFRLTHGVPRSLCLALFRPSVLSVRRSVRPCFSLSPRVISLLSYPFRARPRCGTTPRRRDTHGRGRALSRTAFQHCFVSCTYHWASCVTWRHTHERGGGLYFRERNSHGVILARRTAPR